MQYDHNFTLYCKGSQKDIDRFLEMLGKKWPHDNQDWCEPGEAANSLEFNRIYFKKNYTYHEDLLPYMKKFTPKTGSPLSFFFDVDRIQSDQNEAFWGYSVFNGTTLIKNERSGWQKVNTEKQNDSFNKSYEKSVKPVLEEWLKKDFEVYKDVIKPVITNFKEALAAVQKDGEELEYLPVALKTKGPQASQLCLAAVKQTGWALEYIPEAQKTVELCGIAVQKNIGALEFVPEKLKTAKMYLALIKETGKQYVKDVLKTIPEKLKTKEFYLAAIQQNADLLEYVPDTLKTADFYLSAVQENGSLLEHIPDKLKTMEMYLSAMSKVKNYKIGGILKTIPKNLKTAEFYLAAVEQDSYALKFVPDKLKTAELCLASVKQDGYMLSEVPNKLKTKGPQAIELCLAAVQQDGQALDYVPDSLKTAEICLAAVLQDSKALSYLSDNLKTAEFYLAAVQKNGIALEYVPEKFKTAEICLAAVQQDGNTLFNVPDKLKTIDVCLAAVQNYGGALTYVPDNMKKEVQSAIKTGIPPKTTSVEDKSIAKTPAAKKASSSLEGKSFCFTGELKSMNRKEAEEKVKTLGGSAKSTVAKSLDYLVTNDPDSCSSKNKKAAELGVKIIDEKAFLKLIGEK